jgi:hypothetical protein
MPQDASAQFLCLHFQLGNTSPKITQILAKKKTIQASLLYAPVVYLL